MKLYYKSGACSLADHIALCESGLTFELEAVDTRERKTEKGRDYLKINPKGYVPALEMDSGEILTENAAILQYIGDQAPQSGLTPPAGTLERSRVQEGLHFVGSEVHKSFSPLFRPNTPDAYKTIARETLERRIDYAADYLKDRDYLVGNKFTVADAYFFTILNWRPRIGLTLDKWPSLEQYTSRIAARPKVKAAMKDEGLI